MTGTAVRTSLAVLVGVLAGGLAGGLVARSGLLERLGLGGTLRSEPAPARESLPRSGERAEPLWTESVESLSEPDQHSRFAMLARDAAPGVVNVHTSKTVVREPFGFPEFPFPEGFREFFEGPFRQTPRQREFVIPSLGTGFIISGDGYMVTNNHVVEGVNRIDVIFNDGTQSQAEIVGQDPMTDIALIRVKDRTGLQPLALGDSDEVWPGDWVIAIGNPFGLEHTVTAGIVSATGRDIGHGPYDDFIQTDAAINPGNSGGPLLNLAGEVIGINTAIVGGAATIGFAVPINMAKEILPQLRASGRVIRGWLGVTVQAITPELAQALGLAAREGVLVPQVETGGPADRAGIQRGDVIVRFGDTDIGRIRDLPREVSRSQPGDSIEVEVVREGERETFDVTIGQREEREPASPRREEPSAATAFGMRVQDLSASQRERLGVTERYGVLVLQVDPDGPAAEAGLRHGDVLIELDREPIEDVADLNERLAGTKEHVVFVVRRGEAALFVAVRRAQS